MFHALEVVQLYGVDRPVCGGMLFQDSPGLLVQAVAC